jgi:hypothetical protein
MPKLDSRLARSNQVLAQKAGETLVLLNLDSGQYYDLNEVGTRVWELCDGVRTASEIACTISEECAAPADHIRLDVLAVLDDLVREKLVNGDSGVIKRVPELS